MQIEVKVDLKQSTEKLVNLAELLKNKTAILRSVGEEMHDSVKARLPEYNDFVTDWLPVAQCLTYDAKCYTVPRVNTQVIVLPGQGLEDAVVIGAIYSKPDPAPFESKVIVGMVADDGVEISYDPDSGLLKIQSPKEINIIATDIKIKAEIDIQGNITHKGNVDQTGNVTQTGDINQTGNATHSGNVVIGGNANVTGMSTLLGDAVIASVIFSAHKHPGVMSGGAVSAPPTN